jgi:hypothetical protein
VHWIFDAHLHQRVTINENVNFIKITSHIFIDGSHGFSYSLRPVCSYEKQAEI